MRLLVLGGTHHVGRAAVEVSLARGDDVTTVTRGVSGPPAAGAHAVYADRTAPGALADGLAGGEWDVVLDTWSSAPAVVGESARLLAPVVGRYVYVSSRSVYHWPIPSGADESAPLVDGDPAATDGTDYAAAKRGAEIAVTEAFGDRALLARAGLILGPYEVVGRLPWWLHRLARGGPTVAPGPADRPLQLIDARDLAAFVLGAAERGAGGPVDTVSPPGHTTIGELLDVAREVSGGSAELVWATPEQVAAAGIEPWTELPIWVPPTGELAALHDSDVSRAVALGLVCRPIRDTVTDTWAWLRREPDALTAHPRRAVGLDPTREAALLASLRGG